MVALGIGADVPFCVVGGRARVEGVGERVTPLPFERREYLLLVPPFGVDTARVYRAWDERPSSEGPNHLARAALAVEPRLAMWRDALGEAAGVEPRLAGSGSTWFVEGSRPCRRRAPGGTGDGPRWCGPAPFRPGGKGTEVRATCRPGAASGWP